MKEKLVRNWLSIGTIFILLISIFVHYGIWKNSSNNRTGEVKKEYSMLAKRIFVDDPTDILVNFIPLRKSLRTQVEPWKDTFSFYFEYLPTGTSIGVNEKTEFEIASLVKIPTALAYYRKEERAGLGFEDKIVTLEEKHLDKGYGDLWEKGAGYQISITEAMHLMLANSDNTAANVIADTIPQEDFTSVFDGLDISMNDKNGVLVITTKGYASILKSLYFAGIVSKENSQKILDILTKTPFDDKLRAGVPKEIVVSHKIGVYGDIFQDCGIVYEPNRPYLLCMYSHSTEKVAAERMGEVSKLVYSFVHGVNAKE
jgi:beta-lactamase class A